MATTWQKESWELYSSGKGRFKAFFIPPACATDLYPPESWLRQHPVPEPWNRARHRYDAQDAAPR